MAPGQESNGDSLEALYALKCNNDMLSVIRIASTRRL